MAKQEVTKEKVKKPFYKRVWFWILAILVIMVLGNSMGGNDTSKDTKKSNSDTTAKSNKEKTAPQPKKKSEPKVPAEYTSALNKADTYANSMDMSKAGLYDQLTSDAGEKFSAEAAQYAIDNVKADWNKNALAKAKSYQDMDMSPEAIRDQLTSSAGEKFTAQEAAYAIQHLND